MGAAAEQRSETWWRLNFAAADGADYHFGVDVYDDGDLGLSARRTGADDGEYFWHYAGEALDADAPGARQRHIIELTGRLLRHETRILQTKGLLNVSFYCVCRDGDDWHYIGGNGAIRFSNFRFPPIRGKQQEYRSPPLLG